MHLIIEYEICALLFLVIITIQFFKKLRFPNKQNRLFGFILLCAVADVVLDIAYCTVVERAPPIPTWLSLSLYHLHFAVQVLFPVLLLVYVITITTRANFFKTKMRWFLLPALICYLILLSNPFTKLLLYIDDFSVYHFGPLRPCIYISSILYLVLSMFLLFLYRGAVQKNDFWNIVVFIWMLAAATAVQAVYYQYRLAGLAMALGVTMMYCTMHNPEDMLDAISGVFNYSALLILLRSIFEEKKEFQLIALEIDGVSRINGMFGLPAGNEALKKIGEFLMNCRAKPWVFRAIGTGFVAITYSDPDYRELLHRVESRFQKPWRISGAELMITARVRHFSSAGFMKTPGEVIGALEAAFRDLPAGSNSDFSMEIDETLLGTVQRQLAVETALREALENDKGFRLFFQPVCSLEKKRFTSAEVLLRFTHPVLGEVSPSEFIPIAEKQGLAGRIDEWVLCRTCRFIQEYRLQTEPGLEHIAINLSAAGILQRKLPETLTEITDSYGVDPSFIVFEITETAATVAYDMLADCMNQMRRFGFRFALDDFGSGYANITQVVNLPFYAVKLDRTLLVKNYEEENTTVVFEDTVQMLKRLGLVTIVEGVETEEQLQRVLRLEADFVQGYFFVRPMPEKHYVAFLEKHRKQTEEDTPEAGLPLSL